MRLFSFVIHGNQSCAKSSQCRFRDSISAILCDRRQPFSYFSHTIAQYCDVAHIMIVRFADSRGGYGLLSCSGVLVCHSVACS
jgi:hypothetical protein